MAKQLLKLNRLSGPKKLSQYLFIYSLRTLHKRHSFESLAHEEVESQRNQLLVSVYLNLWISYIKIKSFCDSIKYCNSSLKLDPKNVKSLFRRGLAFHGLKDYQMARDDFMAYLRHESNNKAARNHLIFCNNAIKAETQVNRNTFTKLFAKQTLQKNDENKVSVDIQDKEEIDCANIY